jgi:hypothetical protein
MDTKQPLALKRRQPCPFQDGKGLHNRIPLGEDHKVQSREQLTTQLPCQFPKQALYPIPADGYTEPFPHHNTDPAANPVSPANYHIKQGGRDTASVLLGILNVAAAFQEQIFIAPTM